MKFSSIRTDRSGQQHLRGYDAAQFLQRIRTDANNLLISSFRVEASSGHPESYRRYAEIPHICVPTELRRQPNGVFSMAACNGLVVLEVRQLMSAGACAAVKRSAMELPMTWAAFVGATGREVIILVRAMRDDGTLPATEAEAETFYTQAYLRATQLYDAVLPQHVARITPSPRHTFLLPLDAAPAVTTDAAALHVGPDTMTDAPATTDEHLLALPEQRHPTEEDMTAYMNYERMYAEAARRVADALPGRERRDADWYGSFVTGVATHLCRAAWPEEETICHLWNHLTWKDLPGLTEEYVRRIVEAVYADTSNRRHASATTLAEEPVMQQIIRRMESRYCFRHNIVMGYTEFRPNHTWVTPWAPVTRQVINALTTDLLLAGLKLTNHDVQYYVHSTRIRRYDPVRDYLFALHGTWDGRDHIGALARTVPTQNARQWAQWFHTWFLAMVAQWQGRDRRYGNALVPLLVSAQGMHKSAFCRSLLPPELRAWGYTDNLSLGEERPVYLAMAQMLLVNLDEFNRISPAKQQGFLKNIVQLPSVKVKRPYATHTEEVPRLASFIATTNQADALADPSGSRRFIGVEVTGDIDVSQTPNYAQLYAQALAELEAGHRYWLDEAETAAVMRHNQQFRQQTPAEQFFHEFFEAADPADANAQWLTATAILMAVKARAGASFKVPAGNVFGRTLCSLPGLPHKHTAHGNVFCVRSRQ